MSNAVSLNVECINRIDPEIAANYGTRSLGIDVRMSDEQIFIAIDTLLDAGGEDKRAQRLAQLAENELNGMHA